MRTNPNVLSVSGLLKNGLRFVARRIYATPSGVLILGGVLTGLSLLFALKLENLNAIQAVLSGRLKATQNYNEYKKIFNASAEYVLLIEGEDADRNREVARQLAGELMQLGDGIESVSARRDFSKVMAKPLLLAEMSQVEDIANQVDEYIEAVQGSNVGVGFNVNSMLSQVRRASNEKHLKEERNWRIYEPKVRRMVWLLNQLANKLSAKAKTMPEGVQLPEEPVSEGDLRNKTLERELVEAEYDQFNDGKAIVIKAKPGVREVGSRSPYTGTIQRIREVVQRISAANPDVRIGLTGEPVMLDDETAATASDIPRAAAITLILITLFFLMVYREYARPGLALITLGMAVAWSFGWASLSVGSLNIITKAFIPMMLGLGIDFGIQLIARYEEELARGRTVGGALEESLVHAGFPVITSGLTASAAFATLSFSDFGGLSELGTISSGAILLCVLANIFILPALITIKDRGRNQWQLLNSARRSAWTFSPAISRAVISLPYVVTGLGIILTLFFGYQIRQMLRSGDIFDYNLLNMKNRSLESVQVEHRVLDITGSNSITGFIIARPEPGEKMLPQQRAVALAAGRSGLTAASVLSPFASGLGISAGLRLEAQSRAPTPDERKQAAIQRNGDIARDLVGRLEAKDSVLRVVSILPVLDRLRGQAEKVKILEDAIAELKSVKVNTDVSSQINVDKAKADIQWLYSNAITARDKVKKYQDKNSLARKATNVFSSMIPPLQRMRNALRNLSQEEVGRRLNAYQVEVFDKMQKELGWLAHQQVGEPIVLEDFPASLRERLIGRDGELLLIVEAKGNIWERGPLFDFVRDLQAVDPDATGSPVTNYFFINLVFTSFGNATTLAFVAILIVVVVYFHSWNGLLALIPLYLVSLPFSTVDQSAVIAFTLTLALVGYFIRDALFALIPLALAIVWTLGMMALGGIKFNPANIMTLPMVIGIGVAYGIYTVDRFRETGRMEIFTSSTGKAIILSAFTTIFAFGSMLASQHVGLHSLGQIMTLGATMALLTSVLLLPQLLEISARHARGASADNSSRQ